MATINGTFNSLIAGTLSGTVATPGATGPAGPAGPIGPQGLPGVGVPAGGLEGQIIVKASDTSYDTVWVDNSAETLTATVRNETGATLTKGTVVYINGASGNKATVTKASASSEASSSKTFAILSADILNNQNGQAVTVGLLKGLNTLAFSPGANLWLSTTAGEITQTPPTSPDHAVFLGNATRIHANQGEIEVRIQNGLELGELHDVLLTSPTEGQVLKYDATSGLWKNGTDVGGVAWGGITGTLSDQTDLQNALNAKQDVSGMSAYLTKAGNLAGLTDLATARDNLQLGVLYTPTFAGVTIQGSGANVANLTPTSLSLTHATFGSFTIQPSSGITFPDTSVQTTAFPAGADVPTGGLTGQALVKVSNNNYDVDWATISASATWGSITGTLSSQTDLQTALNAKANLSGATFTGKVIVPASTTGSAFLNLPHGPLPTSPVNGDVWTTTADMRVRISGVSQVLATQSWVGSQGYTSTTFVVNEVNASKLKPQGTFSNSYEVPSSYNNYMLTLDTSEGTNKSVTFGALTVGSNVTFVQGGTDQIIFPSALAFQNKQASAGQNAVVTAHSTSGGWYLEGDLTYIPAGYVISSTCAYYSGQDAIGVTWDGYYYSEAVIANGSGGTYSTSTPNANGCWYPQGYCIQRGNNYNESTLSWEIYDSNMNMVANGTFAYSYQYDAEFANGDGTADWSYGITFNAYYGYLIANGQYYDSGYSQYYYYDVYSDGGSGYYVNTYQ